MLFRVIYCVMRNWPLHVRKDYKKPENYVRRLQFDSCTRLSNEMDSVTFNSRFEGLLLRGKISSKNRVIFFYVREERTKGGVT